ncbi:hypothetical protein VLK81_07505 [Citroniella saccharovorans]|uniref:Penicillin-binding protein n=1 Tax=Citroniella saccharovorans TaxID=2053367 RepID=A0AAW9N0P4_9FIRM|nr:hypothetical protein [Citroniella saccharovorans]MEB3429852.1 hypothetical protein [Citroniella saccharovorans]
MGDRKKREKKTISYNFSSRVKFITSLFIILFIYYGVRLIYLNSEGGDEYKNKAIEQRISEVELKPKKRTDT